MGRYVWVARHPDGWAVFYLAAGAVVPACAWVASKRRYARRWRAGWVRALDARAAAEPGIR